MFIGYKIPMSCKLATITLVVTMASSTAAFSQSVDWRSDIVINHTSKSQNRANKGNFDFPGLYKSQRNSQSFTDANCRARSARDARVGTTPILENLCDKRAFIVIQNDTFKGDGRGS